MSLELPGDVEVEVWFGVDVVTDLFTLNDPVQGELDNATYTLGGVTSSDVTGDVISASISRGRKSQLSTTTNAGSLSITLDNSDRKYDPENTASPYWEKILPGRRVRITAAGEPLFDGRVEDWDYDYPTNRTSVATITATDALGQLARRYINNFTGTAGQVASERIDDVLDRLEVAFGANRDLVGGQTTLQADAITTRTNAFNYLETVVESDGPGLATFFAARDGVLTFRDRHTTLNEFYIVCTFSDQDVPGFNYLPFDGIEVSYGSELLYNRVSVTRNGGTEQVAYSTTSYNRYGVREVGFSGLLMNSNDQALQMANGLLGIYKAPELRVERLVVDTHLLEGNQRATVLSLELSDIVTVLWTPSQVGDPVTRFCQIIGIEQNLTPDSHVVTFNFADVSATRTFFQLDSNALGVLDDGPLAF